MLEPSHPLFDLQSLAALLSRRPEIRIPGCTEAEAEALLARLGPHCGPTEHAEWLGELGAVTGELRLALPTLDLDTWLVVSRELSTATEAFQLVPTLSAAWEEAVLQGRLVEESFEVDGVRATRWSTVEGDPAGDWELTHHPATHPDVVRFIDDVEQSLQGARLLRDEVVVVVRCADGRTGIELPMVLPTASERVPCPRNLALRGVSEVLHARLGHRALRLAPDLCWSDGERFSLRAWFLLTHLDPLPTGRVGTADLHPGDLATGCRLLSTRPTPPDQASADRARWIRGAFHHGWHADKPAAGFLSLPGVPLGLEHREQDVDDHPHLGDRRWLVRYRDVMADRDLLEATSWRTAHEQDRTCVARIMAAAEAAQLQPHPDERWVEPMRDTQGRQGLAVHLLRGPLSSEEAYCRALDALGTVEGPGPLATVAFAIDRVTVHLWYDEPTTSARRDWVQT